MDAEAPPGLWALLDGDLVANVIVARAHVIADLRKQSGVRAIEVTPLGDARPSPGWSFDQKTGKFRRP